MGLGVLEPDFAGEELGQEGVALDEHLDTAIPGLDAEPLRELREPVPVQDLEHGPALLEQETNLL